MIHLSNILKMKHSLKILNLSSNDNLGHNKGRSLFKVLKYCSKLEELVLREFRFEDSDSENINLFLTKYSNSLLKLDLSGNFFSSANLDIILKGIALNLNIKNLILEKMNLTNFNIENLTKNLSCNIKMLNLSNNSLKESAKYFNENSFKLMHLTHLYLNNCHITDENLPLLLQALEKSIYLELLEMNSNNITAKSCEYFQMFFNINKSVKTYYILNNKIRKRDLENFLTNENLIKVISEM